MSLTMQVLGPPRALQATLATYATDHTVTLWKVSENGTNSVSDSSDMLSQSVIKMPLRLRSAWRLSLRLGLIQSEVWWPALTHVQTASDGSSSVADGHR